jgi:hypothetical protein
MAAAYVISLMLIGLSGLMLDMHRLSWHAAQHDKTLSERDLRFARSQHRRRNQASGVIGILGAAIGLGPLVPARPWPMALYVASMAGACLSIVVLAGLDAWATRQNFLRLRSEQLADQIKMVRELRRDTETR